MGIFSGIGNQFSKAGDSYTKFQETEELKRNAAFGGNSADYEKGYSKGKGFFGQKQQ